MWELRLGMRFFLLWLIASFSLLLLVDSALAQPGRDKDPLSWDRNMQAMFRRYCYNCHNNEKTSGDVNLLKDEDLHLIRQHRETWETVLSVVESGEMPPKKAKQPSEADRKLMLDFLHETLDGFDCSSVKDAGKPTLRRLNRVEYDLCIADLTGLNLSLASRFPPDPSSYGFDNIGDSQVLTPVQVEQYHAAAREVVDQMLAAHSEGNAEVRIVFFEEPKNEASKAETARKLIERFAARAFRRPVEPEFVDRLLVIWQLSDQRGDSFHTAVGHALSAVLIAPKFLLRIEAEPEETDGAFPIDDYELATRLSFFLWSRGPDERLLELAAQGELKRDEVLEAEVRRMLLDERSIALVEQFFGQWLGFREIAEHQVDAKTFPDFNEQLREDMRGEIHAVLAEIIREDRPVTDLIDADYTFLNESLAKFYGVENVTGNDLQRVGLTDRRRGGLLTSAGLLMLQSDPGRSNVPRRGNFIADRILGDAAPPPPPNVPPLEASEVNRSETLRQRFERHRSAAECMGCHAKIDPIGFGLENFDAIGRWREQDAGLPIDAKGELADGRQINGPIELKSWLIEEKSRFIKVLSKNLMIWAMGRGLSSNDECVIREMQTAAAANEDRFSALVVALVKSYPFRHRQPSQ
jgi:hypothetical protein